jgi:hypothetical protein
MTQPEYKDIPDNDWTSLRYFVRRSNERLALLEGSAGPSMIHANLDMDYNRILNGPYNQTTAESDEFITRHFLYTPEANTLINKVKSDAEENLQGSSAGSGMHSVTNIQIVASDAVGLANIGGYMYYWKVPLDGTVSLMYLHFDVHANIDSAILTSTYMDIILPDNHIIYYPYTNPYVQQMSCIAYQEDATYPSYWGIVTMQNEVDYLRIGRIQTWFEGSVPAYNAQMIYPVDFEPNSLPALARTFNLSGQLIIPVI